MRGKGMTTYEILSALLAVNERCRPPLSREEVKRVAESAGKYEPERASSSSLPLRENDVMTLTLTRFSKFAEPKPMGFVVEDFLPEGYPSMLFGDGGQGKSYIVLYLATCIAIGRSFLDKTVRQGRVLYVDFELDENEQARRAYKIARGLGLCAPPEGLLYFSPLAQEKPIESVNAIIDALAAKVKEFDIALTVLDSFGAAVAGDPEGAKDVTAIFRKLRALGTVLILDHQSKAKPGEKYREKSAFGSVYKQNMSRNVWQLQRIIDDTLSDNEVKLGLYHKKSNFGPLRETAALKATFESDAFRLEKTAIDFSFGDSLSAKDRVLIAYMDLGASNAREIQEETGLSLGTVKNANTALKREGKIMPTDEKRDGGTVYKAVTSSLPLSDDDGDDRVLSIEEICQAFDARIVEDIPAGMPF